MSRREWPRARRVDDVAAALIGVVALASLALSTWAAYRSLSAIVDEVLHPFDVTTSLALWTGLVAGNLFVLQVLLLARLPWLERSWGRARLVRWHRRAAYASIVVTAAHVLLFVWQRVSRRPGAAGAALGDLFVRDPHMLLATVGTALIVVVMLSSIAIARRWLRYETWHLLHLWSYVGLALTLPHEFASVDFATAWVQRFWWALYLGGAGLVVAFRVVDPIVVSLGHRLRVTDVVEESTGVSISVGGAGVARLGARSGQFFVWRFGGRGRTRGHPYSLSAAPGQTLRVTVAGPGDGARSAVAQVRPGARVLVEGPYGDLTPLRRRHPHLLMLAAGVGVTPFRALLEDQALGAGGVTLVQRASSAASLLFVAELDRLAVQRDVTLVRLVGHRRTPWSFLPEGLEGPAEELLLELCPDALTADVYLCGPPAWTATVRRVALACGVRPRDIHQEDFGW